MSVGCTSKNQTMETQLSEATNLFKIILLLSEPYFSCQMIPVDPNTFRNPSVSPKGMPKKVQVLHQYPNQSKCYLETWCFAKTNNARFFTVTICPEYSLNY